MDEQQLVSDLTKGLIRGSVDINDVPRKYDEIIINVLDLVKKKSIVEGKVDRVKRIHEVKAIIESRGKRIERKSRNVTPKTKINVFVTPKRIKTPVKTYCIKYNVVDQNENKENTKNEEIENLNKLASYSRNKADDFSSQQKYSEAQEMEEVSQTAIKLVPVYNEKEKSTKKVESLSHKIEFYEESMVDDEKGYEEVRRMKERREQALINEEKKFQEKLEEFDRETNNSNIPVSFKKYSSRLLNLKNQEKMFVTSRDFNGAKTINQEVRQLEKIENEQNFYRWKMHRDKLREQLIEDHRNRMNIIKGRNRMAEEQKLMKMNTARENKIRAMQSLKTQRTIIEKRKTSLSRTPNLKPKMTSRSTTKSVMTTPRLHKVPMPKSSIKVWSTPKLKKNSRLSSYNTPI